ncbi:MAG: D-alanyl-D-alanine carboxypeptidase [Oscillospiraceae bacterium]|nr:D-alanyl-D-alanine carboxypeptidase [Oscillospiraceae bacterium]
MYKKILSALMAVLCIFYCGVTADALVLYEDGYQLYEPDAVDADLDVFKPADGLPVTINAKAAVLMDMTSGKVLLEKNPHEKLYPASVTKIMSMLLIAEAVDQGELRLTDEITTSTNASSKGGSQIWLKEGETMTAEEMLKAVAVYSANDACTALGEHIAGSSEAFVNMMNDKAKALGMNDTYFVNCTGLDDDTTEHLTTAYDVALMSRALLQHAWITRYTTIWMDSLRGGATELVNTNKLVRFYDGATGLKTGTTNKAGCCVSASAKRGETHLIAVVLGSDNSKERFDSARTMLNWGFANYETVTPKIDPAQITNVRILKGVTDTITPQVPKTVSVLIPKGKAGEITQDIQICVDAEAPIEKGQILGKVQIKLGDEVLGQYTLSAPFCVEKLTISILFRRMIGFFAQ